MIIINSKSDIDQILNNNDMVLIYFSGEGCGVCKALKPKLNELLIKFQKIKSIEIKVDESLEISAQYHIFSLPSILFFIEGKEIIRESRYISIQELDKKISRYYQMYY